MNERTLELYNELVKIITPDTVFACIGAVKTTSYLDSIGPQVGDILKAKGIPFVYGTHKDPYNGLTAEQTFQKIKKRHRNSTIIAIDTCCTFNTDKLYKIQIEPGGIVPGAGVNKILTRIGDYSIKAYMLHVDNTDLVLNDNLLTSKDCGFLINKTDELIDIISTALINAYIDASKKSLLDIVEIKTNGAKVFKLL